MPSPCLDECKEERQSYKEVISNALVDVVRQGLDDARVICGIQPCLQQMQSDPECVMLCLLIELTALLGSDLNIPLLLIKAYCVDQQIPHLFIEGPEGKMAQLLAASSQSEKGIQTHTGTDRLELSPVCLMVKMPKGHLSHEDDLVLSFIKDNVRNYKDSSVPVPHVTASGMDTTLGVKLKTKKVKLEPMPT